MSVCRVRVSDRSQFGIVRDSTPSKSASSRGLRRAWFRRNRTSAPDLSRILRAILAASPQTPPLRLRIHICNRQLKRSETSDPLLDVGQCVSGRLLLTNPLCNPQPLSYCPIERVSVAAFYRPL